MRLLAEELQQNREELKNIKKLTEKDVHMSALMIKNNFIPSAILKDTLYKYRTFFSNLSNLNCKTDALEVLKGSSLMQYISDKRMLQNILQTYYHLDNVQTILNKYYALKAKVINGAIFSRNKKEIVQTLNMEHYFYDHILYLMNQSSFLNYIVIVPDFMNWQELDKLDKDLDKQIRTLEEYYKFQL